MAINKSHQNDCNEIQIKTTERQLSKTGCIDWWNLDFVNFQNNRYSVSHYILHFDFTGISKTT